VINNKKELDGLIRILAVTNQSAKQRPTGRISRGGAEPVIFARVFLDVSSDYAHVWVK
jgi:hypothetical protein